MVVRSSLRNRRTFAQLSKAQDVPHLIDLQLESFRWLTDPKDGGLRAIIDELSPIEDYSGSLSIEFGDIEFGEENASLEECKEKDLTYSCPLQVQVSFVNKETGEIREQAVFLGDFPWMTNRGTFIINGTERVIVTQLVRSPGAYVMEPKDPDKQMFNAALMPQRGSWIDMEIDKKGKVAVRIDRKRKLPVTVLLRSLEFSEEEILKACDDSPYIHNTLDAEPEAMRETDASLIELFKKQRPGEPPSLENARALLDQLFFDPKRYDLTKVGRYKLNARLGVDVPISNTALTREDILALVRELVKVPTLLGVPDSGEYEDGSGPIKDFAAEARSIGRDAIGGILDEYEHFGNRRLRTVGELIQEVVRIGLFRSERVIRERLTTQETDAITPQTIINIRPLVASLKEFFGSSQLSQFMDQTNSLSGLTHRRRLSALGAGGLTRERAPIEVRDVHPTHYGRMCPIETPEGPNIGLIGSLSSHAKISEFGFITTPYRVVENSVITDSIVYLDASQEQDKLVAQANATQKDGKLKGPEVLCRTQAGQYVTVAPKQVDLIDVHPEQIWSVATALIPFLEHDDANRALMGSNMMRQAVPLVRPGAPLIGTGMEARAALDSGDVIASDEAGTVAYVDAERIVIDGKEKREYPLLNFQRSNQGTVVHQRPVVFPGEKVKSGQLLADGSSTDSGELAIGRNLMVAFMSWEGYNFEDAIILSNRLVKEDVLTSIHIEEYEIDARATKLGDEEITRDIPNRSEDSLRNLDERGVIRVGAEVRANDLLVGKVTPKGETELTAEEKLIRAIFKEQAREVRDTSLKVPHGSGGVVIDVKTFSRSAGDDLQPGVHELVRVYIAQKRKISEGDKLAGRHGNKGVISKIIPEEDMPHLADGTPVDVILNPLGVPSRMNLGQILESHLGWAAARGWYDDGTQAYQDAHTSDGCGQVFVSTPVFDGASVDDVDTALLEWQNSHQGPIEMHIEPDAPKGRQASGKMTLYNGRTGQPFDEQITVGYMYILKLLHLVDDKIHARSTGPYSLVTQQPLGGKAQFGGQRFGEMEVWALEAYGAAHTLQEMLTVKSDDTIGRVKAYEAIVKGENIAEPSVPESFKVLLKEIQALGLNIDLLSDEGGAGTQASEEEDHLLRAAEELGIDLAGVRASQEDVPDTPVSDPTPTESDTDTE